MHALLSGLVGILEAFVEDMNFAVHGQCVPDSLIEIEGNCSL